MKISLRDYKKTLILIALLLIALLSGLLHLPIFPGVDFVFGSIVTIMVIMSYGFRWGIAAALLSSIYTVVLWQQPYALIIFTIEAVVVGFIYKKPKETSSS